ncbi:MAG: hypothetical protein JWQ81_87 [Amycolatopsis sp.]|uniref:hypothetical protein n=1 Tax=Amycolatopsis sp. TaxID=37632 RepID=UPI0026097F57|nr:hypothetical protein [Amycolatopsis sp.]MCU1679348.1 hypothetical protein [Amycolatopsis sp.]
MSRGKGMDGPEDVDAAFAEIVADLRAEGVGLLPEDTADAEAPTPEKSTNESSNEPEPTERGTTAAGWRGGGTEWDTTIFSGDPADDDEHFVPPEPPPLPRPRKGAFLVLLLFIIGLFLLIAPNLLGIGPIQGTPLGILALATGIALLLLRVRQGPPPGADPSNGAQV